MQYRNLGRSGIKVSTISLGSWLTFDSQGDEDTAIACVHRAYELGVNLFDTANEYQDGRAEEALGKALAGIARDTYLLATKVFVPVGSSPLQRGLSRKHITDQVDASMRRLGVDYIDLYQCHRYDVETPVEETCQAMDDLVRSGKILYWGVSEWTADQIQHAVTLCRARRWTEPISNQPQYSALWRTIEDHILPTCRQLGVGTLAWSPLAMGVLTGKYTSSARLPADSRAANHANFMSRYMSPRALKAVAEAQVMANEANCTLGQIALAWCLRGSAVASAIVGASRVSHVEENVLASDVNLTPQDLERFGDLLMDAAVS